MEDTKNALKVIMHKSVEEALASFTELDKVHSFRSRSLKEGKEIKSKTHENANEWIVIFNGQCGIKVGNERGVLNGSENKVFVVHIPKNAKHSFVALRDIYYFVLRDGRIDGEDMP